MTITAALILAGGVGQRLQPLTATTPKCLVPVGDCPLLDYWVDALVNAGIPQAVVNTHHLADQVEEKVRQVNRETPLRLVASHEPELLGSAGTLRRHHALADDADEVVVIYADNLSDVSLAELLSFHRAHDLGLSMMLFRASRPEACGIAQLDRHGTVVAFEEKPRAPQSDLANAGVYVLDATAYREVAESSAFDLARDVLPQFVGRMKGYVHRGYHRDIGSHESLAQARRDILGWGRQSA